MFFLKHINQFRSIPPASLAIVALMASGLIIAFNPINFISDDAFFYLIIAKNLANSHWATFDQVYPANGFHPLWAALLSAWLSFSPSSGSNLITNAATIHVLLTILTLFTLFMTTLRLNFGTAAALVSLLPVFFLLTVTGVVGSEASISAFMVSLTLYAILKFAHQETVLSAIIIGVLIALTFLARLDNIFFCFALILYYLINQKFQTLAISSATAAVFVSPYFLWNFFTFGHMKPISGELKSSFPQIASSHVGHTNIVHLALTTLIILTILYLFFTRNGKRTIFLTIAAGPVVQYAYHFLFQTAASWYWYSIVPSIVAGILAGAVLNDILNRTSPKRATILISLTYGLTVATLFGCLAMTVQKSFLEKEHHGNRVAREVWETVPAGERLLVGDMQGRLQFFGSGPVLCLNGLTDDWVFRSDILSKPISEFVEDQNIGWFLEEEGDPNMRCRDAGSSVGGTWKRDCVVYYGVSKKIRIPGVLKLSRKEGRFHNGDYTLWKILD